MPILDPIVQYKLSNHKQKSKPKSNSQFIIYLLNIASKYIYHSNESIKAYLQFKKDLQNNFLGIKDYFKLKDNIDNIAKLKIPNLYNYFKGLIKDNGKTYHDEGNYFEIRSISSNFNFYQPNVDFDDERSWFLCNSPIAILCLKLNKIKEKHFCIIALEADLMAASGYTLVLCITDTTKSYDFDESFFGDFIENHHFSEIHINYESSYVDIYDKSNCFYKMLSNIRKDYSKYESYFYLYSQYLNISETDENLETNKLYNIYKYLKKMYRFTLISFGDTLSSSLKAVNSNELNSCYYCKDGFENNTIKVILCDVPIYDSDDDIKNLTPVDFAYHDMISSTVYIQKDDFLFWEKGRVQVGESKFVDFDDIHYINPELYVDHPMYLAKVTDSEMKEISKIIYKATTKYNDKKFDKFKKEWFLTVFNDKKSKRLLAYVLYAYKKTHTTFNFLKSQVFVAYKAIDFCIQHRFSAINSGFVYEVSTGEGKSSIVILIAAVLGLFGKTVHVVTSNIILANRDYNESCKFFAQIGLKSAVLVHQNELPEFNDEILQSNYPDEYYGEKVFKNSMGMNFYACGAASDTGKADIIFSNLINFESMYLYMKEKYSGRVEKYFKNSSLVIDEADLILIDELPNGTILSKSMKSNSEDILSYIYNCRSQNKDITAISIYAEIKRNWPECTDIKINDIEIMFKEIDLVNEDEEFKNNRKYILDEIKSYDKEVKKKSNTILKEVVPFNYNHTGILERNKEFSGYIQQFIALKERRIKENIEPNEFLVVKDISMNYLYISHPIYISFYDNVCGLTGTVGKKSDKIIFKEHYHLQTRKVPKENPNKRYQFPTILCTDEKDRNEKIINEIMAFHMKGNPVLAIFFSPSDINKVKDGIESHKDFQKSKVSIGVYDGKNDKVKPDKNAGEEGAISLGTNVCGRGTHIEARGKPLHVIVTFYTTNIRAMNQAFGRTARQQYYGTVRIICLLKEFIIETIKMDKGEIEKSLGMLGGVNRLQNEYIDYFRQTRKWIFDIHIQSQKIPIEDIKYMRSVLINVNRINAYNFKFPLGMKYKTFLDIQAQKIFSLYNCPNSKYTWRLFQQYIREMILESWSLVLNRAERKYKNSHLIQKCYEYNDYIDRKKMSLMNELLLYLPQDKNKIDIVPTFMHIFRKVAVKYSDTIISIYGDMMPGDKTDESKSNIKTKLSMINLGFRPYSLSFKSGSKIYDFFVNNPRISYIEDPELKYQRIGSKFCSITEKIDNIFETICNTLSNFIGDNLGFKLFLRRTLGGCEFGLCYDFDIQCKDEEIEKLKNCLVDKDPLFVFSISVKSVVPFLAGVLVFFLLYLANIARQMVTFIQQIPKLSAKVIKKLTIQFAKLIAEKAFDEFEDRIVGSLCDYLKNLLNRQIDKFSQSKRSYYLLFRILSELLIDSVPDHIDKIYGSFDTKIKINTNSTFGKIAKNGMQHVFKIGFLVVLCAASFLINFQIDKSIKGKNFLERNKAINYSNSKVAEQLTKGENYKDKEMVTDFVKKNEKILDNQLIG